LFGHEIRRPNRCWYVIRFHFWRPSVFKFSSFWVVCFLPVCLHESRPHNGKQRKMKIKITIPPKTPRIRFAPPTKVIPDNKKKDAKKACRRNKNQPE
jgi:hypothetical protein